MKRFILAFCVILATTGIASAQNFGIKTNFMHWATTTPNIGAEIAFNRKYTMEIGYGLNRFTFENNKKAHHWIVQPELRYWLCESFNGHFFGFHGIVGEFNIGGIDVPLGRLKKFKNNRYEGFTYGAGLSYGYQWVLSKRWNFECNIGGGYVYIDYDKYPCVICGTKLNSGDYHYFGVTKAAVSLIYLIK